MILSDSEYLRFQTLFVLGDIVDGLENSIFVVLALVLDIVNPLGVGEEELLKGVHFLVELRHPT